MNTQLERIGAVLNPDGEDYREWKPGWDNISSVDDGMQVWIIWPRHTGTQAVRCTVTTACGVNAHIVNKNRGVDTWAHIRELRLRSKNA